MSSLAPWRARWGLRPDGAPFRTGTSLLQPVRTGGGRAAMLKLALVPEERFGNGLMVWWDGDGAAEVLEVDGPALLMARASGGALLTMFRDGREAEASLILARALDRLHRPRPSPPEAIPMERRCAALFATAAQGGLFAKAATLARGLLDAPQHEALLHGDAHPGNILDFGRGDWRAIDPKRIRGERTYDLAAVLVTPDLSADPARLDRQLTLTAAASGAQPQRLLAWTAVSAALSAAWSVEDGTDPAHALAVAEWALARVRPAA